MFDDWHLTPRKQGAMNSVDCHRTSSQVPTSTKNNKPQQVMFNATLVETLAYHPAAHICKDNRSKWALANASVLSEIGAQFNKVEKITHWPSELLL